jgi:hypothetical protein
MCDPAVLGSRAVKLGGRSERGHRALRWLSAVVLLWAVVTASAFSGRSYSWCLLTQELCSDRCADNEHRDAGGPAQAPTVDAPRHADYTVGELPDARRRQADRFLGAPPALLLLPRSVTAAAVPRFIVPSGTLALRPAARRAPPRAGPCNAAERCAALQVFHC